jgi:DNA-binding transcriptional ArsR family regulator
MAAAKHDHSEAIRLVRGSMPSDELLCDLGDLFKIFGDTTRVKILYSLFESELCVCAIAELLNMEQSAISHQLTILRHSKLVGCRRQGKTNIYYLADGHVRSIIGQGFEHLTEGRETAQR